MLRFLLLIFACLLALISAITLLVAHGWGWSEYSSPDLYVVYYQVSADGIQYFVGSANSDGDDQKLTSSDGNITQIDCSPDGRTLAFLTSTQRLYTLTSSGKLSESPEDPRYTTVSVANDGTTALFDPAAGVVRLVNRDISLAAPDRNAGEFDRIDISSRGLLLWMRDFSYIQIASLTNGSVAPSVPHGYAGQFLANEQIFAFVDNVTDEEGIGLYGGEYLMDIETKKIIKIGSWDLSRPLSPDGTKVAGAFVGGSGHLRQVVVYDLLNDNHRRVVTHDTKIASQPLCFLTFRPNALISGVIS